MKVLTVTIDERTKIGKSLLGLLESFSKDKKGVKISDTGYDPKFVAKIKKREKELRTQKTIKINPDDLWGSLK